MESKMTAVEWLVDNLPSLFVDDSGHYKKLFEQAKEMEREQHGETWDAALIAVDRRGGVILRALPDFDNYWEKRNAPSDEGIDQPGLPEGGGELKTNIVRWPNW